MTMVTSDDRRRAMNIEYDYIQYLKSLVGDTYKGKTYSRLFSILYDTEFYYYINNDDNRAADGISWRNEFMLAQKFNRNDRRFVKNEVLGGPCNFLEMLIGLADRMDQQFTGEPFSSKSYWFWVLCGNCGLIFFSDDLMDPNFEEKVHDILTRIMDRTYAKDGSSGLFPLEKHHSRDQTRVEIWYQMQAYLEENYEI